jgi:hypothetical protein
VTPEQQYCVIQGISPDMGLVSVPVDVPHARAALCGAPSWNPAPLPGVVAIFDKRPSAGGTGGWTNDDGSVRIGPGLFIASGDVGRARPIPHAHGIPPAAVAWLVSCPVPAVAVFVDARGTWAIGTDAIPDLVTRDGTRLYDRRRMTRTGDAP